MPSSNHPHPSPSIPAKDSSDPEPAPVIVALDAMDESDALALARALAGRVWGFKIHDLLFRAGVEVVPRLKHYGKVFCDHKLFDIPQTVANKVRVLAEGGADLITLHCSGGEAMLRAARKARQEVNPQMSLLGVTVLTSFSDADSRNLFGRTAAGQVRRFAQTALTIPLDGVIVSPAELKLLDRIDPDRRLLRVTPGVRPAGAPAIRGDDQQRTLTPSQAIALGAGLLVIGRPITAAPDPVQACEDILAELNSD